VINFPLTIVYKALPRGYAVAMETSPGDWLAEMRSLREGPFFPSKQLRPDFGYISTNVTDVRTLEVGARTRIRAGVRTYVSAKRQMVDKRR